MLARRLHSTAPCSSASTRQTRQQTEHCSSAALGEQAWTNEFITGRALPLADIVDDAPL